MASLAPVNAEEGSIGGQKSLLAILFAPILPLDIAAVEIFFFFIKRFIAMVRP
jgi:hypothetical protein